jgi:hypothetical protein
MTGRLRNVLTSTATCLVVAVTGCSTGSANPPQAEGSGDVTGGTGAGSGTESGATTASGSSGSATASGSSGTTTASGSSGATASGATSGTGSGSSGTAASGSTSGASGSSSGAASGAASGSASGASGSAATLSFADVYANDIGCICVPCHAPPTGGGYVNGKLDLSSSTAAYTNLVGVAAAGGACGTKNLTRVVAGNAATSLLYNKVNAKLAGQPAAPCGAGMPDNATSLTSDQVTEIKNWINGGAHM